MKKKSSSKRKAILFCTYCSGAKRKGEKRLPAIKRYISSRILAVYQASKREGALFSILSGEFGLIGPWTKIPYYDHLLKSSEVTNLIPQMVKYLQDIECPAVHFYHDSLQVDAAIKPYLSAITRACRRASVPLLMIELSLPQRIAK
ncbi:MAG: hypothetical protein P8123_10280 [bacterium]